MMWYLCEVIVFYLVISLYYFFVVIVYSVGWNVVVFVRVKVFVVV